MFRSIVSAIALLIFLTVSADAQTVSIRVGSSQRNMIVYAPSGLNNPPLLISLHGMNQDPQYQKNQTKYEPIADREKFIVVFPEGINKRWDISGNTDIDFLKVVIDTMVSRYNVDRNRVYVSGFSMGGMMSYHVANRMADRVAAIGPVSGYLFNNTTSSSRPMPIMHIHGTTDDVVLYSGVASVVEAWRIWNKCPSAGQTTKPYPASTPSSTASLQYWGPCDNGSEIALITLENKGHWHSLDVNLNSSEELWAFFKKHSLGGTVPNNGSDSVLNGNFSSGTTGWTLNVWNGSATGSVVNEEYQINIATVGTIDHQIQLVQAGLRLEQGKSYQVTFDARGAVARVLGVNVEMAGNPFTSYLAQSQSFNLTTSTQTFSFVFKMEHPTDINGRLGFNVGTSDVTVFLDNISIKPVDLTGVLNSGSIIRQPAVRLTHQNSLNVEFISRVNGNATLKLFDLKGAVVKTVVLTTTAGEINSRSFQFTDVPNGLYTVKISHKDAIMYSSRILLWK